MIRDATLPPETIEPAILADCRHLVDGINAVFLSDRAVLPIGLDGDYLICAIADIDDTDTLAALAFASGRQVMPIVTTREAILAAIAPPAVKQAAPLHIAGVRHAQAVVSLREHIAEASSHRAQALRIVMNAGGGMAIALRDDQSIELSRLSRRDAHALVGAADALAVAGRDGGRGFAVRIAGHLHRATVEQAFDGRIVRFVRDGIDPAP